MKVMLLDPCEVFRIGLQAVLSNHRPDLDVMEAAACADPERVACVAPDLVLADLHISPGTAIGFIARLHEFRLPVRFAIMSRQGPQAVVRRALDAGASGFLLKTMPAWELVEAVDRLLDGQVVVPAPTNANPGRRTSLARGMGTLECLSIRERQVFDLVVAGWGNKEIAAHLSISVKTIETHRCHINSKLGVHTAADIVRVAACAGALDGARPRVATQ